MLKNREYLNPDDPHSFGGFSKRKPDNGCGIEDPSRLTECPLCHGFGGWNLRLNAYGPGRHFQASCSQCNGWGWVEKGTLAETCIHEWGGTPTEEEKKSAWGPCSMVKCKKCGHFEWHDTSD